MTMHYSKNGFGMVTRYEGAGSPPNMVDVAIVAKMRQLAHVEGQGDDMERDMELVRTVLGTIRKKADLQRRQIKIDGYDPELVGRHIAMLFDAGYIEGTPAETNAVPYKQVLVMDLTWEGHEFYGALATDEDTWAKVKAYFGPEKLATVPLKVIGSVATSALEAWAKQKLGL